MVYDINNFVKTPSPGDRVIFIYDPNGTVTMTVDPYSSTFYHNSKYVYILTDGKMNINQTLQFETSQIASDGVARLNDVKKQFIDGLADNCGMDPNFLTSGQSDVRYVNIIGDTMTGELTVQNNISITDAYSLFIEKLRFNSDISQGIALTNRNTLVDSNGSFVLGNQYQINTSINLSSFVDIFSFDETESCLWFYTVIDGNNLRTGQISAVWNSIDNSTDEIAYSHTTTNDVGNTDDIIFKVEKYTFNSQTKIRLFADIQSGNWKVRMLRFFI